MDRIRYEVLAGTGHRPPKLGGYGPDVAQRLETLALAALNTHRPYRVISGMALGWDMALAKAAITAGIPLHAYIPCPEQARRWPLASQRLWEDLLDQAAYVFETSSKYTSTCMTDRNRDMVIAADAMLALWDGSPGGTGHCVGYALDQGKPVINLWNVWQTYNARRPTERSST